MTPNISTIGSALPMLGTENEVSTAMGLFVSPTRRNAMSGGLLALIQNPEQFEKLRRGPSPVNGVGSSKCPI